MNNSKRNYFLNKHLTGNELFVEKRDCYNRNNIMEVFLQ